MPLLIAELCAFLLLRMAWCLLAAEDLIGDLRHFSAWLQPIWIWADVESAHTFSARILFLLLLLGGYGKSPDSDALKTDQNRVDLLSRFMESLGVRAAVLLSPSMSGHYSIPFLMKNNAQLHGFIPIAPVGTKSYTPQQYQTIQVRETIRDSYVRHDVNRLPLNFWVICVQYIMWTRTPLRHDH